jgi:hypothetical protein
VWAASETGFATASMVHPDQTPDLARCHVRLPRVLVSPTFWIICLSLPDHVWSSRAIQSDAAASDPSGRPGHRRSFRRRSHTQRSPAACRGGGGGEKLQAARSRSAMWRPPGFAPATAVPRRHRPPTQWRRGRLSLEHGTCIPLSPAGSSPETPASTPRSWPKSSTSRGRRRWQLASASHGWTMSGQAPTSTSAGANPSAAVQHGLGLIAAGDQHHVSGRS